ncbi:MAG: diguanylate cyclase (GGDEF)-like protein [Planctomycetota bacterium]|jgi:two-component system cell cycle response regulator
MTDSSADKSLFSLAQIQHLMRVEFNRAQRYGYPISCIMVAVDRLGHLRDLYGYEAKEEIVDSVISLLKGATRSSDFLGRLADDRLLAVIPHTGGEGVSSMCERLLANARKLDFQSDGRTIPVSLAIGGSHDGSDDGGVTTAQRTMFFDALLQAAEEALEDAAAAGGDRALFVTPDELGAAGLDPAGG